MKEYERKIIRKISWAKWKPLKVMNPSSFYQKKKYKDQEI